MERQLPRDLTPEEAILHQVSNKLASTSDCREALGLVAYHATKLLQAAKTSISLDEDGRLRTWAKYIEPGGYFEFARGKGPGASPIPEESHPLMYETLRSGRPHIGLRHTVHELKERLAGAPLREALDIFYIFEPLRVKEDVVGVVAINLSRENLERISPSQRYILQQLLSLAGRALESARTRAEALERREKLPEGALQAGDQRPSGLPLLESMPWGTHAAVLYGSPPRLLSLLVPYFVEGLRADELCVWVLGGIRRQDALAALGEAIPDIEGCLSRGQLTLAEAPEWYLREAPFSGSGALKAWREQVRRATEAGYEGVRGGGDTSFLEPGDFPAFMEYEAAVHEELSGLRAIALCAYNSSQWSTSDLVDIIQGHTYVLVEKEGGWRLSGSAERLRAKRLQKPLDLKRAVLRSLDEAVLSVDLEGRIIYASPAAQRTFGYSIDELRQMNMCDLYAQPAECRFLMAQLRSSGVVAPGREAEFRTRSGKVIFGRHKLSALCDRHGRLSGAVAVVDDVSAIRSLQGQAAYLAQKLDELSGHGLVGVSQAMREVMRQVELVARTDSTVLILGETGTGKELIARAIHELSPRKGRPMVKVHCAALSPGLIESEFFGHEKGAFTGAASRKTGRFELADGGTIFLDEVGDVPLETQVKLLRVLQEREFERVGGTRTIRVDVRIVAATNSDLEVAVNGGTFRRDLYYRLNVFPIRIPPLRDRPEAIPVLAAHFAYSYAKTMGKDIEDISPESIRRLQAYPWPGNVRELRNVIERAVITAPGPVITLEDFGLEPLQVPPEAEAQPLDLDENERRHILRVLKMTSWRIAGSGGAAELLNINPSTLRSRMKKLGIGKSPPSS